MSNLFYHQKDFRKEVLQLMKEHGDNRSSLAEKADISRPTLNKLIHGEFIDERHYDFYLQKIKNHSSENKRSIVVILYTRI